MTRIVRAGRRRGQKIARILRWPTYGSAAFRARPADLPWMEPVPVTDRVPVRDGAAGSEIRQSMRSGGLRHTGGIVGCRLDGRGWQGLRCVGEKFAGIIGYGCIWIDVRVRQ